MIRSVNIVKNTRKYKYLFVKKIGLILIAMTAGFVFLCVYTVTSCENFVYLLLSNCAHGFYLRIFLFKIWQEAISYAIKNVYQHLIFFVVGWSKVIKIRRHSICWEWNSNELYLVQLRIMTHQYACQIYHLLSYKNILKVYI